MMSKRAIGRPKRYAKFEEFEALLPKVMAKRPAYCDGVGIFRGAKTTSVWVKVRLPRGGLYKGRSIQPGGSIERKLGNRSSWGWQELLSERDRLQGLADRGEPLEPLQVDTFEQYAADWLGRKKSTLRSFGVTKNNVHAALNPVFGKKTLNAITVTDVNRWISKQSANLKPSSVKRQLNTFNAIMNDAVRSGVIDGNPAAKADKIKGIEPRLRFVTDQEWVTILETAEKIESKQEARKKATPHQIRGWLRHYVVWAYNSGMRRAEILALTWDNIKKIDQQTTAVEILNTKTSRPRFITCTGEMLSVLDALKALPRTENDNRLFPLSMTTLKRSLTHLWKTSGLEDVRLHDLRRTHASILIRGNVDPRTVAGRLGHSGTATLARHYAVDLGDVDAAKRFSAHTSVRAGKAHAALPVSQKLDGSLA